MSNDNIVFRIEENTYRLRKVYECRYMEIARKDIPADWDTMSDDSKVQYLYDHGFITWFYDEVDEHYNEPSDEPNEVISIEERNQ